MTLAWWAVGRDQPHAADRRGVHLRGVQELTEFRTVHGLPATGTPFNRVLELAGLGKSV